MSRLHRKVQACNSVSVSDGVRVVSPNHVSGFNSTKKLTARTCQSDLARPIRPYFELAKSRQPLAVVVETQVQSFLEVFQVNG